GNVTPAIHTVTAVEVSVLAQNNWPGLSSDKVIAIRSQRDVAANITIDQLSLTGVRLSKVLFDREGYINDTLVDVRNLLNVGVQTLVIDAYWNENLATFQLCPVDMSSNSTTSSFGNSVMYYEDAQLSYKCDSILTLKGLIDIVDNFASSTDTNLSANLIVLIFNIHQLKTRNSHISNDPISTNDTLYSTLTRSLGNKLYTPLNLDSDRENNKTLLSNEGPGKGFPSSQYFLFNNERRVISTIWQNNLPSNSTYNTTADFNVIFTPKSLNSSFTSLTNTTIPLSTTQYIARSNESWRFAYDDQQQPFTNTSIKRLISEACHYGHGTHQSHYNQNKLDKSPADGDNTRNTQSAYKCAALTQDGWVVSNCYQDKYVVCRKNSRAYEWEISDSKGVYFHTEDVCPGDTVFSVPRTALQQTSLINYLGRLGSNYSVWIDMNSIAISDCWVTGGPYASCPYQKVSSSRNFVQMLAPAAAFCGFILFGILLLRLKRVPVQDNRKHWKKLLANYTENEYEGVPS
ncbi:unnamed protein product, partial [Wickerhamomyces anomalus]